MVEGLDYYINDKGQYVFTEVYLERRGHCCLLKCQHCPYGHNINAAPYFQSAPPVEVLKTQHKK